MIACERLRGGSVKVCECRLPLNPDGTGGGWLPCPSEALGVLVPAAPRVPDAGVTAAIATHHAAAAIASRPHTRPSVQTGEMCTECGGFMVRTGTCMTCQSCGSSSGGCS